jgi:hypothetical protein
MIVESPSLASAKRNFASDPWHQIFNGARAGKILCPVFHIADLQVPVPLVQYRAVANKCHCAFEMHGSSQMGLRMIGQTPRHLGRIFSHSVGTGGPWDNNVIIQLSDRLVIW